MTLNIRVTNFVNIFFENGALFSCGGRQVLSSDMRIISLQLITKESKQKCILLKIWSKCLAYIASFSYRGREALSPDIAYYYISYC